MIDFKYVFVILLIICTKTVVGVQGPYQPAPHQPPPKCLGEHETYVDSPQIDVYCEQETVKGWKVPDDAEPSHCVCVTGFSRTCYPKGPCITHIECWDAKQKTVYD